MVFWFFWITTLISAISYTAISGAIAEYYWTRDKTQKKRFPLSRSLGRVLYYHTGSLALGSLILALIVTIRMIVFYFQKQAQKTQNKVMQWCLACLQCCLGCIHAIVKMLNKNAFIEIAIYGYSFCEACKAAFNIIERNAFKLVAGKHLNISF